MTVLRHLATFGSAARAFDAVVPVASRDALLERARQALDDGARVGARCVLSYESDFPHALRELHVPPTAVWLRGDLALLHAPAVAIVGTRDATLYGEQTARALATALAERGIVVVSGLARGIDAASHLAALEAGGGTVAVLGTGVDVAYPRAHAALHARIAREGLLVSEYPPGSRAHPGAFPQRNRLIAALARVTVVVEAGVRSGALITASHALELGRAVAAVPGRMGDAASAGSNALLRDGACVISDVEDLLVIAGLGGSAPRRESREPPSGSDARIAWDALAHGPLSLDALVVASELAVQRCVAAVTELELAGLVEDTLSGELRRR